MGTQKGLDGEEGGRRARYCAPAGSGKFEEIREDLPVLGLWEEREKETRLFQEMELNQHGGRRPKGLL